MEFSIQTTASLHQVKTAALAVGIFADGAFSAEAETLDLASGGAIRAVTKAEFKGRVGSTLLLRNLAGVSAARVVLVGLGDKEKYSIATHQQAEQAFAIAVVQSGLADAVSSLTGIQAPESTLQARARNAAIAAGNAVYQYTATVSKSARATPPKLATFQVWTGRAKTVQTQVQAGLHEGGAIARGMLLTRTLGDLPGNICTPAYLGDAARKLAREFKSLKAEVLGLKQIQALKMGSFLSVARGSYEPPVFIVLRHTPAARSRRAAPIVLVGKGITFDAGGISLKPAAAMDEMKYDMCGAAAVLGTLRAVAELGLEREVIGLIPACENLPSGRANKPGDVVTSMSGKTIEILNTDAEGRLVLCDALTYAERFKPAAVIDIATLTGACVVALGHINSGLFTANDGLAEGLLQAGRVSGDPAWRMPLDDAYQEQLQSNFADMANIGGQPAGSVTAACFLSRFTGSYPWAHLDIAGTAWQRGKTKGASGRPVPLLVNYLLEQARTRSR